MGQYICYDIEIIKAIPGKDRIPNIEYCGGWEDHANMGISVIGFCRILTGRDIVGYSSDSFRIANPEFLIADKHGLTVFESLANNADGVIGFNSVNFDDKVMAANGVNVTTTYDLLQEVRIAAYGSPNYQDAPKGYSYKLADLGAANRFPKTGDGANAAVQWQQGLHRTVIDYCMNDVKITAELLRAGVGGYLVDPNTGKALKLRGLE